MNLFQSLFGVFDSTIATYVSASVERAAAYVTGPVTALATISFIGFGLALLSGKTEMPLREFIHKSAAVALVLAIGGSAANYNTYLASHLLALPDELMGVFSGVGSGPGGGVGNTTSVGIVLDGISVRAMDGIGAMWQAGGAMSMQYYFAALLFLGFFLYFAAAAAFAVGLMKFALGLAVALGPLLLVGVLFKQTRDFFTRWLSYTLQFAVLGGLIGGTTGLADVMMAAYLGPLDDPAATLSWALLIPVALALLLLAMLFRQLPSMASSITGGIGLSTGSLVERTTARMAGGAAGAGMAAAVALYRRMMAGGGGAVSPGDSGSGEVSRGANDDPKRQPPTPRARPAPQQPAGGGSGSGGAPRPTVRRPSRTAAEERQRIRERDRERGDDK